MPKLIFLLGLGVAGFAGYTVWQDPFTGPKVRAMIPSSFGGMPTITASAKGGPDGTYGGIGAAGGVAGAVMGAVKK